MSDASGFDYDLLISRLHGGLRAFQSLRAHRRQRDQPPSAAPEEHQPPTPPRDAPPPATDHGAARAGTPLEPRAFIALNGRVVPLFGDLPVATGTPTATAEAPPTPPAPGEPSTLPLRPPPAPAHAEARSPLPTAPAPAPSPLRLPAPTPPARLGLIHGGHPAAAPTSSDAPTGPTPVTSAADVPSSATLTALLDARAHDEALRIEKIHAEHRTHIGGLLREHRDALRMQGEAHAAQMAQVLRDVLAEHRAELTRVDQAHAEKLAQVLSEHRQEAQVQRERSASGSDELRSALIEHANVARETTEDIAEHIGALTTIVADLGQTVGMIAIAAVHRSDSPTPAAGEPPPCSAPSETAVTDPDQPSVSLTSAPTAVAQDHARASPATTAHPGGTPLPTVTNGDRARVLQCVDEDREDEDLDLVPDGARGPHPSPSPRPRLGGFGGHGDG